VIVLDTHAWVWWEGEVERLSATARRALERAPSLGVPAICLLEVVRLVDGGRYRLDRPPLVWLREALAQQRSELLPLTPEIAVRSLAIGDEIRDPADRLVAATALEHGCPLVTKDERLAAVAGLDVVW
jgi:PIN domain nuclease of toxin-antitoxin system